MPYILAIASKNTAGDKLYLLVVNRHMTDNLTSTINFNNFKPLPNALVHTLNGPDILSGNETSFHVNITYSTLIDVSESFSYIFPSHSVTIIEFSAQ